MESESQFLDDYPRLEIKRIGSVLVVRPLVRMLGIRDNDNQTPEAVELRQLMAKEAGPLLLDLRSFAYGGGLDWLILLHRDCKVNGRKWMICVHANMAEVFAITKLDRYLPVAADFDEAVLMLSQEK